MESGGRGPSVGPRAPHGAIAAGDHLPAVARHTIEQGIVDLHQHKRDLADSLLEGSDIAARLSAGDMLNMLQEGLKK